MKRVVLLGKRGHAHLDAAVEHVRRLGIDAVLVPVGRGERPRLVPLDVEGAVLVSYLCPWIVDPQLLKAATLALNFHPGPPEYPGIGCTNFALYDSAARFGVTCHHMAPKVDSGAILAVRRFSVLAEDSVLDLTTRCYEQILALFREVLDLLASGGALPKCEEHWARRPYRRTELNALCRITPDMPDCEIQRRVRATSFPGAPGAYVELGGHRFDVRAPAA